MSGDVWVGPHGAPDTYQLLTLLGGGGEGEVWKAVLPLSEGGRRTVAVKILHADSGGTEPDRWERFGHLLRSLSHPGLVRVLDVFLGPARHTRDNANPDSRAAYVVMDYVDGPTLREWCVEHPDATAHQRLRMLRTIASALDDMHSGVHTEIPVAHGDVKPANVVVGDDDTVVLVDLGLARLTDSTGIAGRSAPYAAPEIRGNTAQATPEADRYAFTATLAQVLTGQPIPTTTDGWLDPVELEYRLRTSPITQRRPVLARRILDALDAPPEARPRPLRAWLDATSDSLSEITAAPSHDPSPAVSAVQTGDADLATPASVAAGPARAVPEAVDPSTIESTPTDEAATSLIAPNPPPPVPAEAPTGPPRRGHKLLAVGVGTTIAVIIVAVLMAVTLPRAGATAGTASAASAAGTGPELFLEPAATPGQDPFTDSVSVGEQPLPGQQTTGTGSGTNPQLRGDAPGLYGGTRNNTSCDPAKLVSFLQTNPDKGKAWATALGIQPEQIAAYVAVLTPVVLRADTRVTNHGYRSGVANSLQSTLEAGSAVLIDQTGVPRVRCACGNPLAEPQPITSGATFTGASWSGYAPKSSVAVAPGAQTDRFTLIDTTTGQPFTRPVGTDGSADAPVADSTTPPSPAPPTHGHEAPTTAAPPGPSTTPPPAPPPPKPKTSSKKATPPPPDSAPDIPPNCGYDGDELICPETPPSSTGGASGGGGGGGGGGDGGG
jgi:serine/threonine protein kinase